MDKETPPLDAAPITVQPGGVDENVKKNTFSNFLDKYLAHLDTFKVEQKIELTEAVTNYETANEYAVRTAKGAPIFHVFEKGSLCTRLCCANVGPYRLHLIDNENKLVLVIKRPCKCCVGNCNCCICCCSCFGDEVTIETPDGRVIGSVQQGQNICCFVKLKVYDEEKHTQLYLRERYCCRHRLCCHCTCCSIFCRCCNALDLIFPVYQNGSEVGQVVKNWGGIVKESSTDADDYTVTFPLNLKTEVKAGLLAATLLLDYMKFEKRGVRNAGGCKGIMERFCYALKHADTDT